MVGCSAVGCTNRSNGKNKTTGISFFRFPKDPERRREWTKCVAREDWTPGVNSYLCMNHFEKKMINFTYVVGPRLRDGAYPTIFKNIPKHTQFATTKRKEEPWKVVSQQKETSFGVPAAEHGYFKVSTTETESTGVSANNIKSYEAPEIELATIEISTTDIEPLKVPKKDVEVIEVSLAEYKSFESPETELEHKNSNKPTMLNSDSVNSKQREKITKHKILSDFDMVNTITRLRRQISIKNKLIKNLRRTVIRRDKKIKILEDKQTSSLVDFISL